MSLMVRLSIVWWDEGVENLLSVLMRLNATGRIKADIKRFYTEQPG